MLLNGIGFALSAKTLPLHFSRKHFRARTMNNLKVENTPKVVQNAGDADLLVRLGIVLALRQRAGWQVVRFGVRNGVVKLGGIVPTFHDRQLVAMVTRHVAGVRRVEDELTVSEPSIRQQTQHKPDETATACDESQSASPPLAEPVSTSPAVIRVA
jgi:hypothetical protein